MWKFKVRVNGARLSFNFKIFKISIDRSSIETNISLSYLAFLRVKRKYINEYKIDLFSRIVGIQNTTPWRQDFHWIYKSFKPYVIGILSKLLYLFNYLLSNRIERISHSLNTKYIHILEKIQNIGPQCSLKIRVFETLFDRNSIKENIPL